MKHLRINNVKNVIEHTAKYNENIVKAHEIRKSLLPETLAKHEYYNRNCFDTDVMKEKKFYREHFDRYAKKIKDGALNINRKIPDMILAKDACDLDYTAKLFPEGSLCFSLNSWYLLNPLPVGDILHAGKDIYFINSGKLDTSNDNAININDYILGAEYDNRHQKNNPRATIIANPDFEYNIANTIESYQHGLYVGSVKYVSATDGFGNHAIGSDITFATMYLLNKIYEKNKRKLK